ncbi:hypothetical protein T492DRAFT_1041091 [Pavlovales sp. CCMP2436]|nr:hypothetical protein T492DRAFT_1041091 [Pavlovales sp. CCMP2436]
MNAQAHARTWPSSIIARQAACRRALTITAGPEGCLQSLARSASRGAAMRASRVHAEAEARAHSRALSADPEGLLESLACSEASGVAMRASRAHQARVHRRVLFAGPERKLQSVRASWVQAEARASRSSTLSVAPGDESRANSLLGFMLAPPPPEPARSDEVVLDPPARTARRTVRCDQAVVEELDARVSKLVASPISIRDQASDERILHQWCALNRKTLFSSTPFLFGYEWYIGPDPQFDGDLLLWDGAANFLAVECKIFKPLLDLVHKGKGKERLLHVQQQAVTARVFTLPYLASRRMVSNLTFASSSFLQRQPPLVFPTGIREHLWDMPMPEVSSMFVTNLLSEHALLEGGLLYKQAINNPKLVGLMQAACQRSFDSFANSVQLIVVAPKADAQLRLVVPGGPKVAGPPGVEKRVQPRPKAACREPKEVDSAKAQVQGKPHRNSARADKTTAHGNGAKADIFIADIFASAAMRTTAQLVAVKPPPSDAERATVLKDAAQANRMWARAISALLVAKDYKMGLSEMVTAASPELGTKNGNTPPAPFPGGFKKCLLAHEDIEMAGKSVSLTAAAIARHRELVSQYEW